MPDAGASPSGNVLARIAGQEPGQILDAASLHGGTIANGAQLIATDLGVVLCSPVDDLDCAAGWPEIGPFDPADIVAHLQGFFPEIAGTTVEPRFARNLAALARQLHELDEVPPAGRRLLRVRILPAGTTDSDNADTIAERNGIGSTNGDGEASGAAAIVEPLVLPSTAASRLRTHPPALSVRFAAPRRDSIFTGVPPSDAPPTGAPWVEAPSVEIPSVEARSVDAQPVTVRSVAVRSVAAQPVTARSVRARAEAPSVEARPRPSLGIALAATALGIFGLAVLSIGEPGGGNDPAEQPQTLTVSADEDPETDVLGLQQTTAVCHPSYGGCVPVASDVDCEGESSFDVPTVSGPIEVLGVDVYDLDPDGDGIACDS